MSVDIKVAAKTIRDCALMIDNATKAAKEAEAKQKGAGEGAALSYGKMIRNSFNQISNYEKIEGAAVSADEQSKLEIRSAIEHFLKSAKAAEDAMPQAVALLGKNAVIKVQENLHNVLKQLKLGEKVDESEPTGRT